MCNEVNGLLVPVRNTKALMAAMLRLYDDAALSADMGAASLIRARNRFDARIVARSVLDHFDLSTGDSFADTAAASVGTAA